MVTLPHLRFNVSDLIIFVGDVINKIMTLKTLFQNTVILKKPRVAFFADIIEIVTMIIKKIFKHSKKS